MVYAQHMQSSIDDSVSEFLRESNAIEGVYDDQSLHQAHFAWDYLITQDTMTTGVVLKTHKILMLHQPLRPNEKGYFRTVDVWVGKQKGANPASVPYGVEDWCGAMGLPIEPDNAERLSQQLHVWYERIHPFVDGNGRTGRMFMNWWRLKNGLQLLIIKETDRFAYYDWFNESQGRL